MAALVPFFLLAATIGSLWVTRKPRVWGVLLTVSLAAGLFTGLLSLLGLAWIVFLLYFWLSYRKHDGLTWFLVIVIFSLVLKMRFLPGFSPIAITPKFYLGMEGSMIGFFPLALIVPLSHTAKEWRLSLQGTLAGIGGIALMAVLAILTHTVSFECKLPSEMALRTFSNLFFTSIPEEGFYRGFLQNRLCSYFGNRFWGKAGALVLTSLIFTAAHIFWTPDLSVLVFVFIASLLYGGVYLWSGRIEAAIATHFFLNLIHQSCFTYHAM